MWPNPWRISHRSGVFIVNFENISHLFLAFLLMTRSGVLIVNFGHISHLSLWFLLLTLNKWTLAGLEDH